MLILLGLPLLKEWFVGVFKEDGHGSEAGSFEVKVEVHVVFWLAAALSRYDFGSGSRKTFFVNLLLFGGVNHCDILCLWLLFLLKFKRFFESNSWTCLFLALLVLTLVFLCPFTIQSRLGCRIFVSFLVYHFALLQYCIRWLQCLFLSTFGSTFSFHTFCTHFDQMKVGRVNTGLSSSIFYMVELAVTREVRWLSSFPLRCLGGVSGFWLFMVLWFDRTLSDRKRQLLWNLVKIELDNFILQAL